MRLSKKIIAKIKEAVYLSFGEVDVYLFGSRVDDTKKGGDIDIALDVELSRDDFRKRKVKFLGYMMREGYELKIDIVPYKQKNPLFQNEIEANNIKIA